ncbi:MAG: sensor domain-containing protein, partial [Mycobacterium sp.]
PDNRYATTVELADAARDAITVPIQQSTPRSAPAPPTEPGQPPTMLDDRTPPSEPPDPALATTQRGPVGYPALGVHGRLPTPPRPQASASPETGGASAKLPAGPSRRAVIAISALTALVIAGVAIAAVVIARKSSSGGVATPSTSTATSSTAAQPIAESELDGLLLSPDQIYAATGASPGTTASVPGTMPNNSDVEKACQPVADAAAEGAYADSGWTAVRGQQFEDNPDDTHWFDTQFVVLFPSAQDADSFFTASTQRWPACSNRQFTTNSPSTPDRVWAVGPISDANGILSATVTDMTNAGWVCHRALTVRNNVTIDVGTCGYDHPSAAVDIAQQIAAKVPNQ